MQWLRDANSWEKRRSCHRDGRLTIFWPPFLGGCAEWRSSINLHMCSFCVSEICLAWRAASASRISKLCRYLCHFWQCLRRRCGSVINLQHLAADVASCSLPVASCQLHVACCLLHVVVCRAVSQEYVNWLANGCQCISLWCARAGAEPKNWGAALKVL